MVAQKGIGIGQVFFGLASIVAIAAAPACGGAPSADGSSSSGTSNVTSESGCAADPAITVCPGGSAGYRCEGAAVPDTSLDCSAGPPASAGETLFCCSGSSNQSAVAGSSGAGSSAAASAGGSLGSGNIGTASGGGIGTASDGPGGSTGTSGTNTSSSGTSAVGSGDAGSQGGSTASFVGTWDLAGTLTFSNCTNRSDDGSGTESRSITWALGGPGLLGTGPSCTFEDTVSGNTASFAASTPSCTVPNQSTGEVDVYTVQTFTWTLAADGATAQVNEIARETATYSDGSTASCQLTFVQTATRH